MRSYRSVVFVFVVLFLGVLGRAQTTVPAATGSISAQTLAPGAAAATFNLQSVFTIPGVSGQLVQFDTVFGKFNVEMRADAAPQNVANFLNYVQAGAYTGSIIHRVVGFNGAASSIVQGGGFRLPLVNSQIQTIPENAPVPLEYNLPNARGTLAAARLSDPNTATDQWYFNTTDNSSALDQTNLGGYTVFGRVIGTGMNVVDALALPPPRWNFGGAFTDLPLRNYTQNSPVTEANLVVVNSITAVPLYPSVSGASAMTFAVQSSNPAVATGAISGSLLAVTPVANGSATITVTASDPNGNSASSSFAVTVVGGPQFTTQPISQSVGAGGTVILSAATGGSAIFQWRRNGADIAGATGSSLTLNNLQPTDAGVYTAVATDGTGSTTSQGAVIGIQSTAKVSGGGTVVGTHIQHPNGNFYDQVLLTGPAATVTADPNTVTRLSYIDLNNDIVQVEFAGKGTLTLTLDNATGPAAPTNYNQPTVSYMKGHATIVINGADETTNVSVFSVGYATAFDPTGKYNILQAPSATNDPTKNGSSLFTGHSTSDYDGWADVAVVAIASTNGKFGGVRTSNATYFNTRGFTGVYAPGVQFTGPVFVGDISASDNATPTIVLGSASDVRITGGDLKQANNSAVQVDGMTRVQMAAGTSSEGTLQPAQTLAARLQRNGVDVTDQLVPPSS